MIRAGRIETRASHLAAWPLFRCALHAAEEAVRGLRWNDLPPWSACSDVLARTLHPIGDHRGSAEYRLAVAQSLVEKFTGSPRAMKTPATPVPHESARAHVTGEALYTDDLWRDFRTCCMPGRSLAPHAHALLQSLDAAEALAESGVDAVLTAADVPGEGDTGPNRHDEPLFPTEVMFPSAARCMGAGETLEAAQRGAATRARGIRAAAGDPYHRGRHPSRGVSRRPASIVRGDTPQDRERPMHFEGELAIGGQEHFYLETQCAIAWMDETGGVAAHCSTQHPAETQEVIARVLGWRATR